MKFKLCFFPSKQTLQNLTENSQRQNYQSFNQDKAEDEFINTLNKNLKYLLLIQFPSLKKIFRHFLELNLEKM